MLNIDNCQPSKNSSQLGNDIYLPLNLGNQPGTDHAKVNDDNTCICAAIQSVARHLKRVDIGRLLSFFSYYYECTFL